MIINDYKHLTIIMKILSNFFVIVKTIAYNCS